MAKSNNNNNNNTTNNGNSGGNNSNGGNTNTPPPRTTPRIPTNESRGSKVDIVRNDPTRGNIHRDIDI